MMRQNAERAPLPAIVLTTETSLLTAAGTDQGFETIFARQGAGFGRPGDVLHALRTSGNARHGMRAVEAAPQRGLPTLGLRGKDGGMLKDMVPSVLVVPSAHTQRTQEVPITGGHLLCGALERRVLSTPRVASQEPVATDITRGKAFESAVASTTPERAGGGGRHG